jgi:hypothetical protein
MFGIYVYIMLKRIEIKMDRFWSRTTMAVKHWLFTK